METTQSVPSIGITFVTAAGGEELYDATKDPNQWKNLANDTRYTDVKNELKKWLPKNKKIQSRKLCDSEQK